MTAPSAFRVDSSAPTQYSDRVEAPAPFRRRLRNAIVLLAAAVSLHVWIVRSPQGPRREAEIAGLPHVAFSQAAARPSSVPSRFGPAGLIAVSTGDTGTSGPSGPALPEASLGTVPPVSDGRVRVVQDIVRVMVGDDRPVWRTNPDSPRSAPRAMPDAGVSPSPVLPRFAGLDPATPGLPAQLHGTFTAVGASWRPPVREDRAPLASLPGADSAVTSATGATGLADAVSTADLEQQKAHVRNVLEQYARAYERLDVRAAQAIRPSVDARSLQDAFKDLDAQELRLSNCELRIDGQAANARCNSDATYRQKVGGRRTDKSGEWLFSLTRHEGGWQIVDAHMQ